MITNTRTTYCFKSKSLIILSIFVILLSLFSSCGSKGQVEKMLYKGDYDNVIRQSVDILIRGKDKSNNQPYISFLQDAFEKAVDRDLQNIKMLKLDRNKALLPEIYAIYEDLQQRQEIIRPLLPLYIKDKDTYAKFQFNDYSAEMADIKRDMSEYLYDNAVVVLKSKNSTKSDFRKAYADLDYVLQVNPGFKNCKNLMSELQLLGTDFVHVYTRNDTRIAIPKRLEDDLLNISTWGLNNNSWKVYHSKRLNELKYDYAIVISFREIIISPEQVKERQFPIEQRIEVGDTIRKDKQGNIMKNDNGKVIRDKVYQVVRADIYESCQLKSCKVIAMVDYINLNSEQILNSYPLEGAFVFENIFANYKGDKRALDSKYRKLVNGGRIQFPSNDKMVFDCSESLKNNLKRILSREDAYGVKRRM